MAHVLGIPGALARLRSDLGRAGATVESAAELEDLIDRFARSLADRREEVLDRLQAEADRLRAKAHRLEMANQREALAMVEERLRVAAAVADLRQRAQSADRLPTRLALHAVAAVGRWTRRAHLLDREVQHAVRRFSVGRVVRSIEAHAAGRDQVLEARTRRERGRLERARAVREDGNYVGALAEEEVAAELALLPDTHWVLHDVLVKLPTPVRFRGERRQKVQIDHVVVAPSGVFVLETKRWSAASARQLDCPWHQTARNAFFVRCALRDRRIDVPIEAVLVNLGTVPPRPAGLYARVVRLPQLQRTVSGPSEVLDVEARRRIAELLWRRSSWS